MLPARSTLQIYIRLAESPHHLGKDFLFGPGNEACSSIPVSKYHLVTRDFCTYFIPCPSGLLPGNNPNPVHLPSPGLNAPSVTLSAGLASCFALACIIFRATPNPASPNPASPNPPFLHPTLPSPNPH